MITWTKTGESTGSSQHKCYTSGEGNLYAIKPWYGKTFFGTTLPKWYNAIMITVTVTNETLSSIGLVHGNDSPCISGRLGLDCADWD